MKVIIYKDNGDKILEYNGDIKYKYTKNMIKVFGKKKDKEHDIKYCLPPHLLIGK